MPNNLDAMQKATGNHMNSTTNGLNPMSTAVHAITAESTDYCKKCFEDGADALQKLFGAKSLDKAAEIQMAYSKVAYEGFVAHAAKLGQIYMNLATATTKSSENFIPQVPAST